MRKPVAVVASSHMNATVDTNKVAVTHHTTCAETRREFLYVPVSGWDDVSVLRTKVLTYAGRDFTFTGWNSDQNVAYFSRPTSGREPVAAVR